MLDTLLILQIVIGCLLVIAILLQKTSSDGVSSLSGSNMNFISSGSATNFVTKATILLIVAFMSNALILANLSTKGSGGISKKFQELESKKEESLPIAK